ncbi:MAG TPA: hypothetical protein DCS43_10165 [Verrucomicrobia bacterium]|nr:hypothetical protein [Verrucomicrobiota bacterium]
MSSYNAPSGYHDDWVIALAVANLGRWEMGNMGSMARLLGGGGGYRRGGGEVAAVSGRGSGWWWGDLRGRLATYRARASRLLFSQFGFGANQNRDANTHMTTKRLAPPTTARVSLIIAQKAQ